MGNIEIEDFSSDMHEKITKIDDAVSQLRGTFTNKGLVNMIQAMGTGLNKRDIEEVLYRMERLKSYYFKEQNQ